MNQRKKRQKKGQSKHLGNEAWKPELNRQLNEVTRLLVRVLKALRFSSLEITEAIISACKTERPLPVPNPRQGRGGTWGNVLRRWAEDPRYVGEDGRPKIIPIQGRGISFRSLVAETIPEADFEDCLNGLVRMKSVVRLPGSRLRLASVAALYAGKGSTFVEDVLDPIEALLRTVAWNITEHIQKGKPGIFERGVNGVAIPKSDLEDLYSLMATHGMSLLEEMDAWLNRRALRARQQSRSKTRNWVRPYIGVYASHVPVQ